MTMVGKRYLLEQQIGSGGQGAVYRGLDRRLERPVAIKLLHNPAEGARFEAEARRLASLDHPSIPRIHDFGVEEVDGLETAWLVMQLIEGRPIDTLIDQHPIGRVSALVAAEIIDYVCSALTHAHARGVVHRDVKPANIMQTDAGHCYLVDFGISTLAGTSVDAAHTDVRGTERYRAPEYRDDAAPDSSIDMWAVGVLGHELLTGRVPYDGIESPTHDDYFRAVMELVETVTDPRAVGLLRRVGRMIDPDPNGRGNTRDIVRSKTTEFLPDKFVIFPREPLRRMQSKLDNYARSHAWERCVDPSRQEATLADNQRLLAELRRYAELPPDVDQDLHQKIFVEHVSWTSTALIPVDDDFHFRAFDEAWSWMEATGRRRDGLAVAQDPYTLSVLHPAARIRIFGPADANVLASIARSDVSMVAQELAQLAGVPTRFGLRHSIACWPSSIELQFQADRLLSLAIGICVNGPRIGEIDGKVAMGPEHDWPHGADRKLERHLRLSFGELSFDDLDIECLSAEGFLYLHQELKDYRDSTKSLEISASLACQLLARTEAARDPLVALLLERLPSRRAWRTPLDLIDPEAQPLPFVQRFEFERPTTPDDIPPTAFMREDA